MDTGQGRDGYPRAPMTSRILTREQVLKWNPDWSYSDRELIEHHLHRLNPQTFYVPPSGGYIGCIDVQDTKVMFLFAGYVEFKRDLAPADRPDPDWPGLPLSTFRPHGPPTPAPVENQQVCAIHHFALPLTGICDECQ